MSPETEERKFPDGFYYRTSEGRGSGEAEGGGNHMTERVKGAKIFPENFYWGAATASYQVEGGIENTDWAKAGREGKVPTAGLACDHYNRFESDFDIAKSLGHNSHRFSIEWARIEPEEGKFDEKEIDHYKEVLKALRARGLEPFITLWHFTLPLWFSESGGFEREDSPEIFARYCTYVVEKLSDQCGHFSTINEPNVWAGHGWVYGAWPPFKRAKVLWKKIGKEDGTSERTGAVARFRNLFVYLRVERHLVSGHNLAYDQIKEKYPNVAVGVVKHVRLFESDWNPVNIFLARVMQYLQTYRFMNAVREHLDEIGLNYYRHTKFGDKKNYMTTDMGWRVYPSGIKKALLRLKRYKKPIFIAEAGIADRDDDLRADYIQVLIASVWEAMQKGVDVHGYMYWSLLDNFEWALGYDKRFGLVEIDYKTLERTIRPSAYVYKEICESNTVV